MMLDAIDRQILAILQAEGRISNSDLADHVGLSPSPCLRRLRRLEEDGFISRYVAWVDQKRVGLPVSIFISIRLDRQAEDEIDRFEREIKNYPEVMECYLMTGSRDYLLRVVAADVEAYERFLKQKLTRVKGVASIESSFALNQVKYTNVLPIPDA